MAFMLGKNEGRFMHIKPDEVEPLRETLHYLREHNVHIRTFWTSWERSQDLWHNIQVPVGSGAVKVRASRRRGRAAVEQTLGETLGDEDEALVVIDPREMPRAWAQVCACTRNT